MTWIMLLTCCCTTGTNQHDSVIDGTFKEESMLREKRASVVMVRAVTEATITPKTSTSSHTETLISSGSGTIVENIGFTSLVLTAAHVCDLVSEKQIMLLYPYYKADKYDVTTKTFFILMDIEGNKTPASKMVLDKDNDNCILIAPRMKQPAVSLSEKPARIGQRVYSMNFPRGIWAPGYVPTFEGFYIGDIATSSTTISSAWSIPSIGGSSGGAVFNVDGEIVGIIHAYFNGFNQSSIGATHKSLKKILEIAESTYALHQGATEKFVANLWLLRMVINSSTIAPESEIQIP